jgi:hypothetical protein
MDVSVYCSYPLLHVVVSVTDIMHPVIQLGFQTGDQKYKFMEDKQYVAAQRYIKSPSSSVLSLEFKISEVV